MAWKPKHAGRTVTYLVIFTAVSVVASIIVVTSVLNLQTGSTHTYHAIVTNGSGLRAGSPVKIAGINVGTVDGLKLSGRKHVEVTFEVSSGYHVYADTRADIRYANLVGTRYLDLSRKDPSSGAAVLPPGGTIPVARTSPALDLTAVFNGFQPLFSALTPSQINKLTGAIIAVFQGEQGTTADLVRQIGTITQNLADRKHVISTVITNLSGVLSAVGSQSKALGGVIHNFDQVVDNLADQKDALAKTIDAMSVFTTQAADLTQQSSAAITKDVAGIATASKTLSRHQRQIQQVLANAPKGLKAIESILGSGSFLKVYLCNLDIQSSGELNVSLVPGLPAPQKPTNVTIPSGVVGSSSQNSAVCR